MDAIARQCFRTAGGAVEFDELVSWGREGLLGAAQRFDEGRGIPFRAFASYRVRGAILDGMRSAANLPRRTFRRLQMMEASDRYSESAAADGLGAPPPGETARDAQRLLDDHLAAMATAIAAGLVHDAATGDEGEKLARDPVPSPEELAEIAQLRERLSRQVDELPDEERELVRRHYFEGERFDHVASELGLSKSWASRLHTRAIARLTKRMRNTS